MMFDTGSTPDEPHVCGIDAVQPHMTVGIHPAPCPYHIAWPSLLEQQHTLLGQQGGLARDVHAWSHAHRHAVRTDRVHAHQCLALPPPDNRLYHMVDPSLFIGEERPEPPISGDPMHHTLTGLHRHHFTPYTCEPQGAVAGLGERMPSARAATSLQPGRVASMMEPTLGVEAQRPVQRQHPHPAGAILLDPDDLDVGEPIGRREGLEPYAIESGRPGVRAEPHETLAILGEAVYHIARQPIRRGEPPVQRILRPNVRQAEQDHEHRTGAQHAAEDSRDAAMPASVRPRRQHHQRAPLHHLDAPSAGLLRQHRVLGARIEDDALRCQGQQPVLPDLLVMPVEVERHRVASQAVGEVRADGLIADVPGPRAHGHHRMAMGHQSTHRHVRIAIGLRACAQDQRGKPRHAPKIDDPSAAPVDSAQDGHTGLTLDPHARGSFAH